MQSDGGEEDTERLGSFLHDLVSAQPPQPDRINDVLRRRGRADAIRLRIVTGAIAIGVVVALLLALIRHG
jgi:hypothetical protein